jgi:hypothetical protein
MVGDGHEPESKKNTPVFAESDTNPVSENKNDFLLQRMVWV